MITTRSNAHARIKISMNFAVIQFPGSNCDQDCIAAINGLDGLQAEYVWHKETSLDNFDAIVLPGGFAYGDYLRCGAIARFSPVMKAVISDARAGKLVLGTCNGFQVLCEAGLLPGALVRNRSLRFVCDMVITRVEVDDSPFTHGCPKGTLLRLPVAHGEGCFFADPETLRDLNANQQIILRYADTKGRIVPEANPNGSIENIAGICNRERNVFGLMPHPDRASDARLGSADGAKIFLSMITALSQKRTLFYSVFPDSLRMTGWHRYCLKRGQNQFKSYAPRKNPTHEPTGGRVQSTFGQYSILSTTIPDGDT